MLLNKEADRSGSRSPLKCYVLMNALILTIRLIPLCQVKITTLYHVIIMPYEI